MPILDGSSRRFVTRLIAAGTRQQDRPVRVLRVLKPVEVRKGDAWARLEPADGFEIRFHIDFSDEAIGAQDLSLNMANGSFVRELSDCRTFCRQADVDAMRANGLALGGTLENAVVFDGGDEVLSPPGGACVAPTNRCATRCWTPWATSIPLARRSWAATWATRPVTR